MAEVRKSLTEVSLPAAELHNAINVSKEGHVTISNAQLATLIKNNVAGHKQVGPGSKAEVSVGVVVSF